MLSPPWRWLPAPLSVAGYGSTERRRPLQETMLSKTSRELPILRERVVVVVLSDHLDRTERLLMELKHADAGSAGMISPLQDEAQSLLAANRICRQNAKHDDDPALATALDRLDHLLVQLANQPGGLNSTTISKLQDEMNADGLLFEVRVLRSRQAASTVHTKGGTI